MDLAGLAKILGTETELTEDNALTAVEAKIKELTEAGDASSKELKATIDALKAEVAELKKPEDKPDENVIEDAAEAVAEEVEAISASLGLKPADAKELTLALTGPADSRNTFLLSRQTEQDENGRRPVRAKSILNVLRRIDPKELVQTGERTRSQSFTLNRQDGDSAKDATQEDIDKMAEEAYGK